VAVAPDGAFVVAWSEQGDIHAARFDAAGQGLGGDFQVNSFVTGIQYAPVLARAADGSPAAVWTSWESAGTDQSFTNVQLRRLDAAGMPIGADVQVNTSTAGRQEGPAIASLGGEDFVVAWSGYDHNEPTFRSRVWGQRFASTCVTTTTTSTSTTPLPTALVQGNTLRLAPGKGKHAGTLAARLVSHDPVVSAGRGAGSADDPTLHGGLVRIHSAAWGLDASHALAAADWRRTRSGWRYAAGGDKVVVKNGKLLRMSTTVDDTSVSATDPTPVDVLVQLGALRLCLAFQPGTAVMKRRGVVAHDGAAPSACLAP
jgi:hypothetical protein